LQKYKVQKYKVALPVTFDLLSYKKRGVCFMDATNRYIKMCQTAEDIQRAWNPRPCDFMIEKEDLQEGLSLCHPGSSRVQVVDMYFEAEGSEQYQEERDHLKNNAIWLPRQDELQRMAEPDNSKVYLIINHVSSDQYYYPPKNAQVSAPEIFYSMEQLWFAYIMKEKFNKVWNEEGWVSA
jgi:hypothetical protein